MYTLRAAADLISNRRATGYLADAEELARQTHDICQESGVPDVLLYTVMVNLASVLRMAGRPDMALAHDDQARRAEPVKRFGTSGGVNAGHASIMPAPGRSHVGNRHRHVW